MSLHRYPVSRREAALFLLLRMGFARRVDRGLTLYTGRVGFSSEA